MINLKKLLLSFLFLSSFASLCAMEGESEKDSDKSEKVEKKGFYECPLCFEEVSLEDKEKVVTGEQLFGCDARHEFCLGCMIDWLKTCASSGKIAHCPICRTALQEGIVVPALAGALKDYRAVMHIWRVDNADLFDAVQRRVPLQHIFHAAIIQGLAPLVGILLSNSQVNVNARNVHGETELMIAASQGRYEIVRILLTRPDIEINAQDNQGMTALMHASFHGHLLVMQLLLNDARLDFKRGKNGLRACSLAAQKGLREIVKVLLDKAVVEYRAEGWSKVMIASQLGLTEFLRELFEEMGADEINAQDRVGLSALMLTANTGHEAAVVRLLENERIDVNLRDNRGMTALMHASFRGHLPVVQLLLNDARLDFEVGQNGLRACSLAAQKGFREIVKVLLDRAAVEYRDEGWSKVMIASQLGLTEYLRELFEEMGPEEINAQDRVGRSVLMLAADTGREAAVVWLLGNERIDVSLRDNRGMTALIRAASKGHPAVVKALVADKRVNVNEINIYGFTPLIIAAERGYAEVVKELLADKRVDVNAKIIDGGTALILAANRGHSAVVKELVADKRVDVNERNNYGFTPLMIAAQKGYAEIVKELLADERVDVNAIIEVWEALVGAACDEYSEFVKALLVDESALKSLEGKKGFTALMIAVCHGRIEVVKVLVADKRVKDKDDAALNIARKHGQREIVQLLLRKGL